VSRSANLAALSVKRRIPVMSLPFLLSAILFLFPASLCMGQIQNGVPNFTPTESHQFDSVNLVTNTVMLSVPVFNKGGTIPFNFGLTANSNAIKKTSWPWQMGMLAGLAPFSASGSAARGGNYIWGVAGTIAFAAPSKSAADGACGNKYTGWYVTDMNGTVHNMSPGFWTTDNAGTGCKQSVTGTTPDGSGFSFTATGGNPGFVYNNDGGRLGGSFRDRNGNFLTTGGTAANQTQIDAMGLTVVTAVEQNPGNINANPYLNFTSTDVNGGTQTFTTNTSALTIKTNFGCSQSADIPATPATVSTGFVFADGRSLTWTYEGTPGNFGDYTGRLGTITLPTGGTIAYTYSGGNNGIDCNYAVPPTLTRTLSNGEVTTYQLSFALISGQNYYALNKVTDNGGNATTYKFTGFGSTGTDSGHMQALTQVLRYQGNTSGTLLETQVYCYNNTLSTCYSNLTSGSLPTALILGPVTSRIVFTQINGKTTWSAREEHYDTYGDATYAALYDYGVSGTSTPTKSTTITYGTWNGTSCVALTNTYVVDAPCDVIDTDSGNTIGETRISYDANGNVTQRRIWNGTTFVGQTSLNTYNSNGTPSKTFDLNNNETDYSYSATGYQQCSACTQYPFPTQVTNIGTGNYANYMYYGQGGVVATATDRNNATTTFKYVNSSGIADPYWRVRQLVDVNNNTHYTTPPTASNPTLSSTSFTFNSNSSIVGTNTTVDAFNRIIDAQVPQSPSSFNYDTTSTAYFWNGNYERVSTSGALCSTTIGASCPTNVTIDGDPLGRPHQISHGPSYEVVTHTYTGLDDFVQVTPAPPGENSKTRVTEYDGLGRPKISCRIGAGFSNSCGVASGSYSGVADTYSYTSASGSTTQQVTRTDGSNSQSHSTAYDAMGRATVLTLPESGTKHNYYDTSSCARSVSSNGNLVCSTDNLNSVTYQYDSQNRVTLVNANGTSCRHFYYDNSTGYGGAIPSGISLANQYGRMVEAATDSCSAGTLITDEWFAYNVDGTVADMWELSPHSTQYYHSHATFFENGAVQTVQLASPALYTMTFGLEGEGRLNSVVDSTHSQTIVNSATYYPASNPAGATVFGTDGDSFTRDTNTGNVTEYKYTINGANYTGDLTWNSNQTLRKLVTTDGFNSGGTQTCYFNPSDAVSTGYNDFEQLVGFDCGGTNWGQTFSYDAFENMTKAFITGRTGTSWNPGYSATTNHYNIGTYDSNGNVTGDGNFTYGWNEFSKLKWAASSGTPTCGTSGSCITYDALGRIVETSNGSTWTERFYTQAGWASMSGTTLSFAYWPTPHGAQLYESGNGGGYYFMHPDWVGSARVISNNSHSAGSDLQFSPYGEVTFKVGSPAVGQYQFAGMNENFYNGAMFDADNRELSIAANRWLSPDPARQGWNQYAYPANPNTFTDPSGLAVGRDDEGGGIPESTGFEDEICDYWGYCEFSDSTHDRTIGRTPADVLSPPFHNFGMFSGEDCLGCFPLGPSPLQVLQNILTGNFSNFGVPTLGDLMDNIAVMDANPANKGSGTPKICGGTFEFAGMEADLAEGGAFTGVIHEHDSIDGNSVGNLTEGWGGGEVVAAGGGKITSTSDKSIFQGFLGFVGAGISAGPLAGIQIGVAGSKGWSGLYVEGHLGIWAWGAGGYLRTSCKAGG
jgi:hypothetical protein